MYFDDNEDIEEEAAESCSTATKEDSWGFVMLTVRCVPGLTITFEIVTAEV